MTKGIGYGASLVGATTGTIGQVENIDWPGMEVGDTEVSALDDGTGIREHLPTLIDAGEFSFNLIYDGSASGTANDIFTNIALRTEEVWTITLPDTSSLAVTGFLNKAGLGIPLDEKISQPCSVRLSGLVTFTDVA